MSRALLHLLARPLGAPVTEAQAFGTSVVGLCAPESRRVWWRAAALLLLTVAGVFPGLSDTLAKPSGGELWVATARGVVGLSTQGELLLHVSVPGGVRAVAVAPEKEQLWALTEAGIEQYGFDGELLAEFPVFLSAEKGARFGLERTSDGSLWLAAGYELQVLDAVGVVLSTTRFRSPIQELAVDPRTKRVWVATQTAVVGFDDPEGLKVPAVERIELDGVTDLTVDRRSRAWVSTASGLLTFSADGELLQRFDVFPAGQVAASEDSILLAAGSRVMRLRQDGGRLVWLSEETFDPVRDLIWDTKGVAAWMTTTTELVSVSPEGATRSRWRLPEGAEASDLAAAPGVYSNSGSPGLFGREESVSNRRRLVGRPHAGRVARGAEPEDLPPGLSPVEQDPEPLGTQCGFVVASEVFDSTSDLSSHRVGIDAMISFDDGTGLTTYIAGDFLYAGGRRVNHIARWDGETWEPVGEGFNDDVEALAVFDDGTGPALYAGGKFGSSGLRSTWRVAKWSGEEWLAVGLGVGRIGGGGGEVNSLAVFDDGSGPALYAGGHFDYAEFGSEWHDQDLRIAVNDLAKWDGSFWHDVGRPNGDWIESLQVFDDGGGEKLFIGELNDVSRFDGQTFDTLPDPQKSTGDYTFAVYNDGTGPSLYIGAWDLMARWDPLAGSWFDLPGTDDLIVQGLGVQDFGAGERLIVGGSFDLIDGLAIDNVAVWDGSVWSSLGDPGEEIGEFLVVPNDDGTTTLWAGERTLQSLARSEVSLLSWQGDQWDRTGPGTVPDASGFDVPVVTVAEYSGELYIGGFFESIGALPISNLASWDGSSWSEVGTGVTSEVEALITFDDGGGEALFIASAVVSRWDGASLTTVGPELVGDIFALEVFDDGGGAALFAGGDFSVNGVVGSVAKWDGVAWSLLPNGPDGPVYALRGKNAQLYVGGFFYTAGGLTVNSITRWDPPTAQWEALGDGLSLLGIPGEVYAMEDFSGIKVGGRFEQSGSEDVLNIASCSFLGCSEVGNGLGGEVRALKVFDGELFAGGKFTLDGSYSQYIRHLARLPTANSNWKQVLDGAESRIYGLAVGDLGDGPRLFAGGEFWGISNVPSGQVAEIHRPSFCPPPLLTVNSPLSGEEVGTSSITVEGSVDREATVWVNQQRVDLEEDLSFQHEFNGLANGPNELLVRAEDEADLASEIAIEVIADTVAPVLWFDSPEEDQTLLSEFPSFALSYRDISSVEPNSLSFTLDGAPITMACSAGPSRAVCSPGAPLADGSYVLAATVEDAFGNASLAVELSFGVEQAGALPVTTVVGSVETVSGVALIGAQVTLLGSGAVTTSTADGSFRLESVPLTSLASLVVGTTYVTPDVVLTGQSVAVAPVPGSDTDVGVITVKTFCPPAFESWSADVEIQNANPSLEVAALATFDDGNGPALYVGGDFNRVGGISVDRIARWSGASWESLGVDLEASFSDPRVYSITTFDFGTGTQLYIGGNFNSVDGQSMSGVARWDGSAWLPLDASQSLGTVRAFAEFDDGSGDALFFVADNDLYRWDGATLIRVAWTLEDFFNPSTLYDLAVFQGELYVAGFFFETNTHEAFNVARWNGAELVPVDVGVDNEAYALAVHNDGSGEALYVGGIFDEIGRYGLESSGVARWDGIEWSAVDRGLATAGLLNFPPLGVRSLEVYEENGVERLFAGGFLTGVAGDGGQSLESIARWDGISWTPVGGGLRVDDDEEYAGIQSLFAYQGQLYAGGDFLGSETLDIQGIARWDGEAWGPLQESLDAPIEALELFDGGLLAGGRFDTIGGRPSPGIAEWRSETWRALGDGVEGVVLEMLTTSVLGVESTFVGGGFLRAGGVDRSHLASWSLTGWQEVGGGTNLPVRALAAFDDGRGAAVYAGGDFTVAGTVSAAHVARWDGLAWEPLGAGVDGPVHDLIEFDGKLWAGGNFSVAGGAAAQGIATWDGTNWTAVGGGIEGEVRALALYDDGSGEALFAAGDFETAGGQYVQHIATWDGVSWSAVGGAESQDGPIEDLIVFDDLRGPALYATGSFTSRAGTSLERIARWDGTSWTGLSSGLDGAGLALGLFDEGSGPGLFVGGEFENAGNQQAVYFTKWQRPYVCQRPDQISPTLEILSPVDGDLLESSALTLGVYLVDYDSGIDTSSLGIQVDGAGVPANCTFLVDEADCVLTTPLADGSRTLEVAVSDLAGNGSFSEVITVVVDTEPPTLTFTSPPDGGYAAETVPTVSLDYSDSGAGVDLTTLTVQRIDGATTFTCTADEMAADCLPDSPLDDGPVELTATITDLSGKVSTVAELSFVVDTASPTIALLAPLPGQLLGTDDLLFVVSVSDAGSGVDESSLGFTLDGQELLTDCTFDGLGGADCVASGAAAQGEQELLASVSDLAQNTGSAPPILVTVDTIAPGLEFVTPAEGALIESSRPFLRLSWVEEGSGLDEASFDLLAGADSIAVECEVTPGQLDCELLEDLPEGSIALTLTVFDLAGNLSLANPVNVVVDANEADTTPPVVAITQPFQGAVFDPTIAPIRIVFGDSGSGVDLASLQVTANGLITELTCDLCATHADCLAPAFLGQAVTLSAVIADLDGNVAQAAEVTYVSEEGIDIDPPSISLLLPETDGFTREPEQSFIGSVDEPATVTLDGSAVLLDEYLRFQHGPVALSEGANTFALVATDLTGNAETVTLSLTLDTVAPGPVDRSLVTVGDAVLGVASVSGVADAVAVTESGLEALVSNLFTGSISTLLVHADGSFDGSVFAQPGQDLSIVVRDPAGNASAPELFAVSGTLVLPPAPDDIAPGSDPTDFTDLFDVTEFLYTGEDPIQQGVEPDTIDPLRVAILRGRVLAADGQPLSGVSISVLDHTEFGSTLSRTDGAFDLAVNGGDNLVVRYRASGYLPLQRRIETEWRQWGRLPDVVLTALDSAVTALDLTTGTDTLVARGTVSDDGDGVRQATLLFPATVAATAQLPGDVVQSLDQISVRASEYTVGANGPQAMPGTLPRTSGYTYAVEYSIDEADAVAATGVEFSEPVTSYLENFLNIPVGTAVPAAFYDRAKGLWIASENGVVIELLSETGGLADLDVDGSGQPADGATLTLLGITDAEREQVATLYAVGQTLWRVPIEHFSAYDFNFATGPVNPNAERPGQDRPKGGDEDKSDDPCLGSGSIIECDNQILGEQIGLVGTPFVLSYRSDRVPGRKIARHLDIPITGETVPAGVESIDLEIDIAGQQTTQSLTPTPDLEVAFDWDGLDAYGQSVVGRQPYDVRLTYNYEAEYQTPPEGCDPCFPIPGDGPLPDNPARTELPISQTFSGHLGTWDARERIGLGGWSLDVHHSFDPTDQTLYLGDGTRRTISDLEVVTTMAGNGGAGNFGEEGELPEEGEDARRAEIGSPTDLVVDPDGSFYLLDNLNCQVRRIDLEGRIYTEAGIPCDADRSDDPGSRGDGGSAKDAVMWNPIAIERGPDGLLYVLDKADERVLRIEANGQWIPVVGPGGAPPVGGMEPLVTTSLQSPNDMVFGPDGALYVATFTGTQQFLIKRIDLDVGAVSEIVSGWAQVDEAENTITWHHGVQPQGTLLFSSLNQLAFDPEGNLYFSSSNCGYAFRQDYWQGFEATHIAGLFGDGGVSCEGPEWAYSGEGGHATLAKLHEPAGFAFSEDGDIFFADRLHHRVLRIDSFGDVSTVVGTGTQGPDLGLPENVDDSQEMALAIDLNRPYALARRPDGDLLVADATGRVRAIGSPVSGAIVQGKEYRIAAEGGGAIYVFDARGRHLRTEDERTGQSLFTFAYDDNGLVISVTDLFGNETTIARDGNGVPLEIVGPFGQTSTLSLDPNGWLETVTNPENETVTMTYKTDGLGLLESFESPKMFSSTFTWDTLGRLERDTDHLGGYTELSRTELDRLGDVASGFENVKTTQMGRTTLHRTEFLTSGETRQTVTEPDGTAAVSLSRKDGTQTTTSADGTVISARQGPDRRYGVLQPLAREMTVTTPGGLSSTTTTSRQVALVHPLADPEDPASIASITDTVTVNARTATSVYDPTLRRMQSTSPLGRTSTSFHDAFGRPSQTDLPGVASVSYSYDARGRLDAVTQAARTVHYEFFNDGSASDGFLEKVTDPMNRDVAFTYDLAGRVKTQTLPDGRVISFDYDDNGNLVSLTPPGRPSHGFDHTQVDLPDTYSPPDLGQGATATILDYNLDRQVELVTRPDGKVIDYVYDSVKGRLDSVITDRGTYGYVYDVTGNLETVTDPDGGSIAYTYDGSLPKSVTWTGDIAGSVEAVYNNNFELESRTVNASNGVAFLYDEDGLLEQAGPIDFHRNVNNGFLEGTTVGSVTDSYAYDSTYGELSSYSIAGPGNADYSVTFDQRDALGRIVQKTETLQGATSTYIYTYDPAGRLTDVEKDGANVEHYDYDANSNREGWSYGATSGTATYDDQDRLLDYDGTTFTYSANGDLESKSANGQTVDYSYDVSGNLRQVDLIADSLVIDYVLDASNRRIGKKVNGVLSRGWLYKDQLNPIAELDAVGALRYVYTYGSKPHVPDVMEDVVTGTVYRLITDHLGSVRLVVDTANGNVVQQLDYDTFGRVTFDSQPGFQPFGYAGGLYDYQTGLVRFGARDYDPEMGRWTSKDPIGFAGGGMNLYGYVVNDPVNLIDENGLSWRAAAKGFGRGLVVGVVGGVAAVGVVVAAPAAVPVLVAAGIIGIATLAVDGYALYIDPCATSSEKWEFGAEIAGGFAGGLVGVGGGLAGRSFRSTPKGSSNSVLGKPRVGSALKKDHVKPIRNDKGRITKEFPAKPQAHGFPDVVDNFAGESLHFDLPNGASLYQVEGSLNGVRGRFEWILENGLTTHRMFVSGGTVNGVPITP